MYTQCPECHIAFRVTAKVLQQAGGRVQCGGCNRAFNAVDYLSETPPAADAPSASTTEPLPPAVSLTAAEDESASGDPGLSAGDVEKEQSFEERNTELLKALDDLAGPEDILIEDTGVEWRVLEKSEHLESAEEAESDGTSDWYFDDNESDVLAPADDASKENSANDGAAPIGDHAALEFGEAAAEEQRYDDSTPLPDDFEEEAFAGAASPAFQPSQPGRDKDTPADELPVLEDAQVDLALGDPEEWLALLDDVPEQQPDDTGTPAESMQRDLIDDTGNAALRMEAEEELSAIHSELSATLDPFAGAPGAATNDDAQTPADETVNPDGGTVPHDEAADITAEDTSDGQDDVVNEDEEPATKDDLDDEDEEPATEDDLDDEDEEPETVAHRDDADEEPETEDHLDDADEEPEGETDGAQDEEGLADEEERVEADDFRSQIALIEDSLSDDPDRDTTERENASADEAIVDEPGSSEIGELDIEKELAASAGNEAETGAADAVARDHTINVQMHEDMRRAMEDKDFAAAMTGEDGSPLIETIIMEGDFVHGAIGIGTNESDSKLPGDLDEPKSLIDTYALSRSSKSGTRFSSASGPAVIAGVMILSLLLVGQYVHKSREYLATFGLFNQTIGPVYRALGRPVTPAWDIKGWQFETTNGSTDENEQLLTIYSSIANRSKQALPYPLVHVSLTDRWEEIVGSRVLEPNEYLAGDPDPRRPVAAGEKFTAVISIATPSDEVTGFKLNVCYRVDPARLSCAIEDFKN